MKKSERKRTKRHSTQASSDSSPISDWSVSGDATLVDGALDSPESTLIFESHSGEQFTVQQVLRVTKNSEYVFRAKVRCDDRLVVRIGKREMGYQTHEKWQVISDVILASEESESLIEFIVGGNSNKKNSFELSEVSFTPLEISPLSSAREIAPFAFHKNGILTSAIVYPSKIKKLAILADNLRDRLRDLIGIEIPLVSDVEVTEAEYPTIKREYRNKNLIIIGRLGTNRALWTSYNHFKSGVDGYYPGGDGFVVRTALNVTRENGNHIILGGSTDIGAVKAVERFLGILSELFSKGRALSSLPYLLDVKLGGECLTAFEQDDLIWRETPGSRRFPPFEPGYGTIVRWYWNAMCHYWSGWSGYLERAEKLLERVVDDNAYTHHYINEWFVRVLNMFEGSGIFSDELTKGADELVFKNFREYLTGPDLCRFRAFAHPFSAIHLSNRHDIAPWMGNFAMAEYLENKFEWGDEPMADILNYRSTEMRSIMDYMVAHRCGSTFPSVYGADNDEEITSSLFRYALDHEKYEFFEKEHAKQALMMEKINHVAGRYTRPAGMYDYHLIMGILAHYYLDGRYVELMERIPEGASHSQIFQNRYVNGVHRYQIGDEVESETLEEFTGVTCSKVEEFNRVFLEQTLNTGSSSMRVVDEVMDMLCFRGGFGPDDDYVAVSGTTGPVPAGVFMDFTSCGHYWFGAGDSAVLRPPSELYFDHNAVHICKVDAPFEKREHCPLAAKLNWCCDSSRKRGASFTLEPFDGASWQRDIFWLAPGVFVVKDTVSALETGIFDIFVNWFPEGETTWNNRVLTAKLDDACLHIVSLGDDFSVYQNIGSGDDKIFCRNCFQGKMTEGDSVTSFTVLYAAKEGTGVKPVDCEIEECSRVVVEALDRINNPVDASFEDDSTQSSTENLWSYSGLRLPALIDDTKQLNSEILDLGKPTLIAEIRANHLPGKWRQLELPETIIHSADMRSWQKIETRTLWRAGLETGNYGRGVPQKKAYQCLLPSNLRTRYLKAEKIEKILIFDEETQHSRTPLRMEVSTKKTEKGTKIVVGPDIWPPFLRKRLKEDSVLAVLDIDGAEIFKHQFEYKIQSWRLCDLNGSGDEEILILTDDAKLRIIDFNGSERRVVDLFAMHEQFNITYGHPNTRLPAGGFTLPFDFGLWRSDSTGRQKIVISRYCGYSFLNRDLGFEGVLQDSFGYVLSRLLPIGVDFSDTGNDEQLCLGKEGIHHIDGSATPCVSNPNNPLCYPQVYRTELIPPPADSGKIDGEKVFTFSHVSLHSNAQHLILVVRSNYLGLYDGCERKWVFKWLPPASITACDIITNATSELQVLLASEDRRLWCLKWQNDVERLAEYETTVLEDRINRIKAVPEAKTALLCGNNGVDLWREGIISTGVISERCQDVRFRDGKLLAITRDGRVMAANFAKI